MGATQSTKFGATWGEITGSIADNTALSNALNSKLSTTLQSGNILVGNNLDVATAMTVSGDIAISNTGVASISPGVILDGDVALGAAIDANKIANGSVSNTEYQFLDGVTSSIQGQINNKVTKGGDSGATLTIGTTTAHDMVLRLNNNDRWTVDNAAGYLRKGSGTASFGLQLYGTGAGSVIALGDNFDATTFYVGIREFGGTDTDQLEAYGQKGLGLRTGVFGTTSPQLWITQAGNVGIQNTAPVKPFEVVGNSYMNGALTVGPSDNTSAQLSVTTSAANANAIRYTDGTNYTVSGGYKAANVGYFGSAAGSSLVLHSNGTETVRLSTSNKVSIGTAAAATAFLQITGCVAGANGSSLKINPGTLSTASDGAIDYDGTNYYACVGTTRYTIAKILTGSAVLDFPNTNAASSSDLTISITGAALGDVVSLGVPEGSVNANSCFTARVSAADTVSVRFNNYSVAAINPASGTFKVYVTKF